MHKEARNRKEQLMLVIKSYMQRSDNVARLAENMLQEPSDTENDKELCAFNSKQPVLQPKDRGPHPIQQHKASGANRSYIDGSHDTFHTSTSSRSIYR